MKKSIILLLAGFILMSGAWPTSFEIQAAPTNLRSTDSSTLKAKAFNILESKCNVCHRKQNPFMVFKMKNMDKRADKIDKMVFVYKRMPKGDEIKLTPEEREILKSWIQSLNTK